MNKNRIDTLLKRAEFVYKTIHTASDLELEQIERKLNIVLSEEFKYICKKFLYENLGDFYVLTTDGNHSVVTKTLSHRKSLGLPPEFLSLSDDDDSVIFMKVNENPILPSPVYWISIEDIERFCKNEPLEYDCTLFTSFTDFFEHLIGQEEEFQREYREYEESQKKE